MGRIGRWLLMSCAVTCLIGTPLSAQAPEVPRFDPADARGSFARMAGYLARDGGTWRGANPRHVATDPTSPPAFGLRFEVGPQRATLRLTILVHYPDSTVVSAAGDWVWHPGRDVLAYRMVGRDGSVTEGATTFPDDSTFVTVATTWSGDGASRETRDDNVMVSGSVHRNETFAPGPQGEWISGGLYTWRREPLSPDVGPSHTQGTPPGG